REVVGALLGVGKAVRSAALPRGPVDPGDVPGVRRQLTAAESVGSTLLGHPLPRRRAGFPARSSLTAWVGLRLVGGGSSAGFVRASHASPSVAFVASAVSPCPLPLGSSALRATASSVVPWSRFINRTPLV